MVNVDQINECLTYRNILLCPGIGHVEMNMTKGCFKMFWDVFLFDLGKLLGYNSIRAEQCCQTAGNYHKAMAMLECSLFSLSHELLYSYCTEMKRLGRPVTANSYNGVD